MTDPYSFLFWSHWIHQESTRYNKYTGLSTSAIPSLSKVCHKIDWWLLRRVDSLSLRNMPPFICIWWLLIVFHVSSTNSPCFKLPTTWNLIYEYELIEIKANDMLLKCAQTEHWIQVACWLPDCLVWAGHRLDGRISGACLEARPCRRKQPPEHSRSLWTLSMTGYYYGTIGKTKVKHCKTIWMIMNDHHMTMNCWWWMYVDACFTSFCFVARSGHRRMTWPLPQVGARSSWMVLRARCQSWAEMERKRESTWSNFEIVFNMSKDIRYYKNLEDKLWIMSTTPIMLISS